MLTRWKMPTSNTLKGMPNQKHRSPLVKQNHPELDTSEFLDQDGTDIFQALVGAMQWAISIGRWDIQSVVMTLSSFRFRHFKLQFCVDEPDYSGLLKVQDYDWEHSIYGNPTKDILKMHPLGNGLL